MFIDKTDPRFEDFVIFLNGRPVRGAVAANEEEGWVDIVDIAALAPLDLDDNAAREHASPSDPTAEVIPLKRLMGTVQVRKLVMP